MHTTIRNLIVAAPLATAALTLVPAAAMASGPGPVSELPNRVDAGAPAEAPTGELDLAWLFAGGLAVTGSGVAFAVRKRTHSNV
jgi:hypothetical protein